MSIFTKLGGLQQLTITSADIPGLLSAIHRQAIPVEQVRQIDSFTVAIEVGRVHIRRLEKLAAVRGEQLRLLEKRGLFWQLRSFLHRPVLLLGMSLLLILVLWLPSKVLLITVEGNQKVPTNLILEQAEQCGIRFGVSRHKLRSEQLKNSLLAALPELQWAAVNTRGCVAVISVQEKTVPDRSVVQPPVSCIVAACDGTITSCTVTKGTAMCQVGQAVKAGELLVSGYADYGLIQKVTQAEGEIFAETIREVSAVIPLDFTNRGNITGVEKKISVIFGKKRINFYKDSGISEAGCGKMTVQYPLWLPGNFQLPVILCVDYLIQYDILSTEVDQDAVLDALSRAADRCVKEQMIAGSILDSWEAVELSDQYCVLKKRFACHEMIGRLRNEETIGSHGEDS